MKQDSAFKNNDEALKILICNKEHIGVHIQITDVHTRCDKILVNKYNYIRIPAKEPHEKATPPTLKLNRRQHLLQNTQQTSAHTFHFHERYDSQCQRSGRAEGAFPRNL